MSIDRRLPRRGRRHATFVAIVSVWLLIPHASSQQKPVTVEDAIEMTRIQRVPAPYEDIAHFSPDGTRFVSVVWRGDLQRNVNLYSLVLFDLGQENVVPRTLLTWEFASDPRNQFATPFSRISFLADNQTVVFVGNKQGEVPQVHALNTESGQIRRLTEHPNAVLAYALSPQGEVRLFSAAAQNDTAACRALYGGGVSLFDRRLDDDRVFGFTRSPGRGSEVADLLAVIDAVSGRRCETSGWSFQPTAKYFLVPESGGAPLPILDEANKAPATRGERTYMSVVQQLVPSPDGRRVLLLPGRQADVSLAKRYRSLQRPGIPDSNFTSIAVVDLRTKDDSTLSVAPVSLGGQSRILWSRDGTSIITQSLLPLDASNDADNERRARVPPQLAEIDVRSGRVSPIESASTAVPLTIDREGYLVVRDGNRLLRLRKQGGRWSTPILLADLEGAGFNLRQGISTNGRLVLGIRDGLTTPPEIAAYDPTSRTLKILTDLNPALRQRAFGAVEKVFWKGPDESASFGYLIKPVNFVEGHRYPLVILFKDAAAPDSSDETFLIDGQAQLTGHAVQPLAGLGFVVLFTPAPPSFRSVLMTPEEGPRITAHVESGIDYLDRRGLIDRNRVGIGGWSRAAFHTDYILLHSEYPFKAGIHLDGGGNYEIFMDQICGTTAPIAAACNRNFDKLRAARLSEQHEPGSVVSEASLITKFKNLGKTVDFYFYPDEAHDLRAPGRRRHSLTLNVDWYRFWLQDYEDPSPEKHVQYERWRALRDARRLGSK